MQAAEKVTLTRKPIRFLPGDATDPQGDGYKIIVHCCNNVGAWGAGFVLALSKRWQRPEKEYRAWAESRGSEKFQKLLGAVQIVPVEEDIAVANLIGQDGIGRGSEGPPIRYDAISRGFGHIVTHAKSKDQPSIIMPRIGCGLAGGSWARIEELVMEHFIANEIPVTVYDWPGSTFNP